MACRDINPRLSSSVLTDGNLWQNLFYGACFICLWGSLPCVKWDHNATITFLTSKKGKTHFLHMCFSRVHRILSFYISCFILNCVAVTKSQMGLLSRKGSQQLWEPLLVHLDSYVGLDFQNTRPEDGKMEILSNTSEKK